MTDPQNPPRRSNFLYLLALFGAVAVCGFVFQWINYRIVRAVDEYEAKRVHLSRIRPARPLWTKQEWEGMQRKYTKRNRAAYDEMRAPADASEPKLKRKGLDNYDDDEVLNPEVVQATASEKETKWSARKIAQEPPLQLKRKLPKKSVLSEDFVKEEIIAKTRPPLQKVTSAEAATGVLPAPPPPLESSTSMSTRKNYVAVEQSSSLTDSAEAAAGKKPPSPALNEPSTTSPTLLASKKSMTRHESSGDSKAGTKTPSLQDSPKNSDQPKPNKRTSEKSQSQDTENSGKRESNWDSPNLLDISEFKWLMKNESLCKSNGNASRPGRLFSIVVHTTLPHFSARQAIRHSWGSIRYYKNWQIRIVFLMGEEIPEVNGNKTKTTKMKLQVEQEKYGDLVMGSFIDSEKNSTYKHLMGFKWILNFCQDASFVLTVNDNIFVNIMKWIGWVNADLEFRKTRAGKENTNMPEFYCKFITGDKPIRSGGSSVSNAEWPLDSYPGYCCHWAYGASVDAIKTLYSVSNNSKYFWRDDVFATGVLREQARKQYGWKPEVKDISPYVSPKLNTTQLEKIGGLCKKSLWKENWPLHPITYLQRGKRMQKDMKCLWEKIIHENDEAAGNVGTTQKNESHVPSSTHTTATVASTANENDELEKDYD